MNRGEAANVLFIWNVEDRLKNHLVGQLDHVPNMDLIFPRDISHENLVRLATEADVIVGWRPTEELLLAAKKLKLFINPGAGVQHLVDLFREINRSRRVLLANCHGNSYSVAQHAVALLLSLTNQVVPHHNWMVAGEWRKRDENAKSVLLRDRNLGLLGYGAVNRKVHRFLSGFDLSFSIIRRDWTKEHGRLPSSARKYDYTELHDFLSAIDTLIVAVPLISLTKGMIGTKELELLGSDGLLVNVSRGPVIDEESLYSALNEELIAGAAIDVWYNYDPDPDEKGRRFPFSFPFHTLKNVILSPHRAASPLDDLRRWNEVAENIRRFAVGGRRLINVINLEEGY